MPLKPKSFTFHRLPLGLVVHDTDGYPWVYVGYKKTTVGSHSHRFVKSFEGKWPGPIWEYSAVKRETLINKFPDMAKHWPDPKATPPPPPPFDPVDHEKMQLYEGYEG